MPLDLSQIEHFDVQNDVGLSSEQVADRIANGLVNDDKTTKGKTVLQIILSNTFTFFNIVYIVIAAILLYYGMPKQCTFLPVVAANTLIAIVQEIKSKRTLDKLNLLTEPKARVVRDGAETQIAVKEMVLDDIVCIAIGEQISADCVVLDGFVELARQLEFAILGLTFSPVKGPEGNIEFLAHLTRESREGICPDTAAIVAAAHGALGG